MARSIAFASLVSVLVVVAAVAAVAPSLAAPGAAGYDPEADPAVDLAVALERARAQGKHVLLEVGGEWCGWCHRLERFLHDTDDVRRRLEAAFVVVKVNWSPENENEAFLSNYPEIHGFPHLFVLDADGDLLHSQNTGPLESGASYDPKSFLAFVDAWAPGGGATSR